MARLPRYETNVISQAPQASSGAAEGYAGLSARLGAFTQQGLNIYAKRVEAQAREAGRIAGQEGKYEQKDDRTLAAEAFNHANNLAYLTGVHNDIALSVQEHEDKYDADSAGFEESLKGYADGLIGNVAPEIRADVEGEINNRRRSALLRIRQREQTNQEATLRGQFEATYAILEKDILTAARDFEGSGEGLATGMSKLEALVAGRIAVDPTYAATGERVLADIRHRATYQGYLGEFEGERQAGSGKDYLDQVLEDRSIDPRIKDPLVRDMRAQLNGDRIEADRVTREAAAVQDRQVRELKAEVTNMTRSVEAGVDMPEEAVVDLLRRSAGHDFGHKLYRAWMSSEDTRTLRYMPAVAVEGELEKYRGAGSKSDLAAYRKKKAVAFGKKHIAGLTGSNRTDYVRSLGTVEEPGPVDFSSNDALTATISNRVAWAEEAERLYGGSFSVFDSAELHMLKGGFDDLETRQEQVQWLTTMNQELGPDRMQPVMRGMYKQKAEPYVLAGGFVAEGEPGLAEKLLLGTERLSAGQVTMDSTYKDEAAAYFAGVFPGRPDTQALLTRSAVALYAADAEGGKADVLDSSRFGEMLDAASGGVIDYQADDSWLPFGEVNSRIVSPRRDWNAGDVGDWIGSLTPEDIIAMGDVSAGGSGPASDAQRSEILDLIKSRGRLETIEPGAYAVWVNGARLIQPDGEPFVLRYDE